ncbi:MAG TPA: ABC transporter permease [Candidatus Acidoferrales bacterium]|jgi:sodium transport system permease protein
MSLRNIMVVYRKELTDSLRDRRTLISMVVVPIVIFPLMSIGMGTFVAKMMIKAKDEVPKVMILNGRNSPRVVADLKALSGIEFVPSADDYKQEISEKKIRAAVDIPSDFDAAVEQGNAATVNIYDYNGDLKSGFAADKIEKFLKDLQRETVQKRLEARKLPATLVDPFQVKTENVAPQEKVTGAAIGGFLPYFIIVLCLMGATYPAIDLTAGEKERGTIETILCSPVPRTDIVLGKFLMVLTAALCTAVLAIISMGTSFHVAKQMLADTPGAKDVLNFTIGMKTIGAVFLMVLPVAVLFASALIAIALMAKSYKEAQSYIAPLTILVVLPAVAGLMPGVEFNARMALVPILNTSLVCKEIVAGTYHWNYIAIIFASTCVYASAALYVAVSLFKREDVLFRT